MDNNKTVETVRAILLSICEQRLSVAHNERDELRHKLDLISSVIREYGGGSDQRAVIGFGKIEDIMEAVDKELIRKQRATLIQRANDMGLAVTDSEYGPSLTWDALKTFIDSM